MVEPTRFVASLEEPALPSIPRPGRRPSSCRPTTPTRWTATSPAPLVYVNYGLPEDYERLERLGISVKGAIVIARYGNSWRGIKPKVAAEHGAVGCIIYSDPRDDGYFVDDVFPKGPMRPATGVQRGSVLDLPRRGRAIRSRPASGPRPTRSVSIGKDAKSLTKIPVLPISYGGRAAAADGARRTDGAGRVARRAADYLSRRPRPGEGPSQARVQLGPQARQQRRRANRGVRAARSSGWCAAITTTAG